MNDVRSSLSNIVLGMWVIVLMVSFTSIMSVISFKKIQGQIELIQKELKK